MKFLRSQKKASMLSAWKADADVLGLPENVQKGLLFLIALNMSIEDQERLLQRARKLCDKITLKPPHIPEDIGGDFYDGIIQELLVELAERSPVQFESRQIELSSGEKMDIWNRGDEDRLPSVLDSPNLTLSDWDLIMTSLCGLIGANIDDDLEGAFVDGFHFFLSYYPMDHNGTVQIASLSTTFLPPHLRWFYHCLDFDAELLSQGNPVHKVLECFLGPQEPLVFPRVAMFSDCLHYCGPGQKRQEVWDANLLQFTVMAGLAQTQFHNEIEEAWYASACKKLINEGYSKPPICSSKSEVAVVMQQQAKEKWGYDILARDESLCRGAQYTQRACISMLCVANGILQPTWNHFAGA